MNAANPLPQDDRSADHKAHEPSMEEILASIRRIIADDQSQPSSRGGPAAPVPHAHQVTPEPIPVAPSPAAPPASAAYSDMVLRPSVTPTASDQMTIAAAVLNAHVAQAPMPKVPPAPLAEIVVPMMREPQTAPAAPPVQQPPQHVHDLADAPEQPAAAVMAPHPLAGDRGGRAAGPATRDVADDEFYPDDEGPIVSPATDAAVSSSFNALFASHFLQNTNLLTDMARDMLRPMLKSWLDDNLPIMVERLVRAEIERVARGGR